MISDLRLQNFRSFKDASFEFSPTVNIIVGPNASGKTNLLEAVLVIAKGSSYRVNDQELIRIGSTWSRVSGHLVDSHERVVKISQEPKPSKQYELDGKTYKRLTLEHSLPVVLFEPNHLLLFSKGPDKRRDYLDDLLEQTTPGYKTTRRHYKRALSQRNHLLKQPSRATKTQLFPWDLRLSQLGGEIVKARHDLAEKLNTELPKLYRQLSKTRTKITIIYQNTWSIADYESRFLNQLQTSSTEDQLKGFTSHGPHREDLLLLFNSNPAEEVASRGELRTAVLALKVIELRLIEKVRQTTPLLLLDDVFSELDGRRRHALTDYLASYQTFITTTDADIVLQYFTESCNIIPLGR